MWFVDVDVAGVTRQVVVRGVRADAEQQFTLEHEMTFQCVLEGQGIPVPLGQIETELTRLWGHAAQQAGGPELENLAKYTNDAGNHVSVEVRPAAALVLN